MRKLVCFLGLILSIVMIAAGVLLYTGEPMPSYKLDSMESLTELLNEQTLLLFVAADGFVPLMTGVLGLLLSLYGFAAASASKKQMKLLVKLAQQRPAAAPVPSAASAPKAVAPAPKAAAPASKPQPTGVSTWICRSCGSSNPQSRDLCGTCGASRTAPAVQTAKPAPAPRKEPAPAPKAAGSSPWICPVCAMENKGDQAECVCCGEKKPANAQSAARPAAGTWICPTCGMQNGAGANECAVCGGSR